MKYFHFIVTFVFSLLLYCKTVKSQHLEVGTSIGASTYQGDISPFSWQVSVQGSKLAQGLLLGYSLNEVYSVKLSYFFTHLSANDSDAIDEWRKSRNLSFRTKLSEVAFHLDIEPLDYFFKSHKLKPVFHVGLGIFKFNPQTKYGGIYRDLQPLSTEGQGLPGSNQKPYNLIQFAIPFGMGFKYYLTDDLNLEFSFNPRKTFTDYLDDVSESYFDYDQLIKYKGKMAAKLAFRGDEFDHTAIYPQSGSGRGNNDENDWYIFNTFTVMYRFNSAWPFKSKRNVKCPY